MKILLSEQQINNLISELRDTKHVGERIAERVLFGSLPVLLKYSYENEYGIRRRNEVTVGQYFFTNEEKESLKQRFIEIFSYDYAPETNVSILIHNYEIEKNLSNLKIDDIGDKKLVKQHLSKGTGNLYFTDYKIETERNQGGIRDFADSMYLIVKGNDAITVMYGRKKQQQEREEQGRTDKFKKLILNIEDLKQYQIGPSKMPKDLQKLIIGGDIPEPDTQINPEVLDTKKGEEISPSIN